MAGHTSMFKRAERTLEEQSKQSVMTVTYLILLPALVLFTILDYSSEGLIVSVLDGIVVLTILINLYLMHTLKSMYPSFRLTIVVAFVVMTYVLMHGNADGHSFVWYYFLPIGVFYLFGLREGFFWVGLSLVIASISFFWSPYYTYDLVASIRYLVTYSVVIGLSAGMESARARYQTKLQSEKEALEAALAEVRILHGLLPICANCKKIRDDKGYWNQLEHFISTNSDVQFSHGICPDCSEKYLAEMDEDDPSHS